MGKSTGGKVRQGIKDNRADVLPTEHQWFEFRKLNVCKKCGIVRRDDGKNNPCKGIVKVRPR